MKFNLTWDGIIEQGGRLESRAGIHVVMADNEKEAYKRAVAFFRNGSFVDWDAIIENGDWSEVITSD